MARLYLVPYSKYKSTLKVVRPYIKAELYEADIGSMIVRAEFEQAWKTVKIIHIRLFGQGYTCEASRLAIRDLRDTLLQFYRKEDERKEAV